MIKLILLMSGMMVLASCSTFGPTYEVPDYYQEALVREQYEVGKTYSLTELQCSQRQDRCQASKSKTWIQHRSYDKPYYFE